MNCISRLQPDPDDFENFELTEAQKVRRFGPSVRNQQIHAVIDQRIPKNTLKTMNWCNAEC